MARECALIRNRAPDRLDEVMEGFAYCYLGFHSWALQVECLAASVLIHQPTRAAIVGGPRNPRARRRTPSSRVLRQVVDGAGRCFFS